MYDSARTYSRVARDSSNGCTLDLSTTKRNIKYP
nr:MAG TPA: hypothetical protein [Bacteriophage sp.]